jgi:tol-pal system protein YbgF
MCGTRRENTMRMKYVLPCIVLLCFAACGRPAVEKRLEALEAGRARDGSVLAMHLDGMEKRLERVEKDIGEIRDGLRPPNAGKTRARAGNARAQAAPGPTPTPRQDDGFNHASLASAVAASRSAAAAASSSAPAAASSVPPSAAPQPPALSASASAPSPPASPAIPAERDAVPTLVPVDLRASQGAASAATSRPSRAAQASVPAASANAGGRRHPAQSPGAGSASGSRAAYEAALSLYNRNHYAQAASAFAAFLRDAPQSPLAPNAGYWLGECSYSAGKYGDAVIAFKDVAAKYPGHPKAAAALLKAAYAYERMGDAGNADFYRQLLLDDYPSSGPAALARKRTGTR